MSVRDADSDTFDGRCMIEGNTWGLTRAAMRKVQALVGQQGAMSSERDGEASMGRRSSYGKRYPLGRAFEAPAKDLTSTKRLWMMQLKESWANISSSYKTD